MRDTILEFRLGDCVLVLPAAQRATSESLRQHLDGAREVITRLRADNAALREQLARSLGEQRLRR